MARFAIEFCFFLCRVSIQQIVLSYQFEYKRGETTMGGIFGPLDTVHFIVGIGFFMAEVAELQKSHRWGAIHIDRYWKDG